jgi:hypothetical protein
VKNKVKCVLKAVVSVDMVQGRNGRRRDCGRVGWGVVGEKTLSTSELGVFNLSTTPLII